jgi:exopolysaccharide biosynthesis polyprenyl glycosylphosphotransferase
MHVTLRREPALAGGNATSGTLRVAERRTVARSASASKLVASSYRGRDYFMRRLLALSDVTAIVLALCVALVLSGAQSPIRHLVLGLATVPGWLVLFNCYGLYQRDAKRMAHSTLDDIPSLFHSVLAGSVLMWLYFGVAPRGKLAFIPLLLFAVLLLLLCVALRVGTRSAVSRLFAPERVALVGTGDMTRLLVNSLRCDSRCHGQLVGRLMVSARESDDGSLPVLGRLHSASLTSVLTRHRVDRVVVTDGELDACRLTELLRDCKPLAVKVSVLPRAFSVMGPAVEVEDVRGLTVFGVNPPVLSRSSRWSKRCLDVLGAGLSLVAVAPLLALLALIVRLDSRGPAFFRQERIGRNGRRFSLLKLRTMNRGAEQQRAALLAHSKDPGWLHLDHDPRITRVGRLLRLTSLDELPQLWNVLKGDMSLVGPRPLVAEEHSMVDDWARGRVDLTPGITGLWQVLGRTCIPFEEMVKLDYLYVTNWSLWTDIRLILRTLPAVLERTGAN